MILKRTSIIFCILFFAVFSNAQIRNVGIPDIKNKYLDIPYATISNAQKLDIYLPDEVDGPFPVILSIHGGGFMVGDKRAEVKPMLKGLKRGYAVVSINYRLSGEAIWPAQINDCKTAVRWLKANAEKYDLIPDKIVAWGSSAGGHLAALLGTSADVKELEGAKLGNPNESSRIQAVVDWYGPTDFLKMDEQLKESGVKAPMHHSVPGSPESLLLGNDLPNVPELVKEANPETYVSFDDPPFFIQHGLEDNLVPYQGSVNLVRKLGEAIGYEKTVLELFPATGHGGPAFYTQENLRSVFAFIDKHLKDTIQDTSKTNLPDEGSIEIDGFKFNYVVEGEGLPCLVIGSSVYYPRTFSDDLKKHLKIYFVDMRWFAPERNEMPLDSFSIKKISDDIEQIRKFFGLKKPIIMGHSIHGTVAMEYAKSYPDHLSALIMIGSPNIYGNETFNKNTDKAWETASSKRKELQSGNWTELARIKDNFNAAELIVEEYGTMSPKYWYDPEYNAKWLWDGVTIHADLLRYLYGSLFSNYYMFNDIQAAPVPTLVVLGKFDYAIPPLLWEKDKNIENLTIRVLKESAHTPQLEEPEKFDKILLDWLKDK